MADKSASREIAPYSVLDELFSPGLKTFKCSTMAPSMLQYMGIPLTCVLPTKTAQPGSHSSLYDTVKGRDRRKSSLEEIGTHRNNETDCDDSDNEVQKLHVLVKTNSDGSEQVKTSCMPSHGSRLIRIESFNSDDPLDDQITFEQDNEGMLETSEALEAPTENIEVYMDVDEHSENDIAYESFETNNEPEDIKERVPVQETNLKIQPEIEENEPFLETSKRHRHLLIKTEATTLTDTQTNVIKNVIHDIDSNISPYTVDTDQCPENNADISNESYTSSDGVRDETALTKSRDKIHTPESSVRERSKIMKDMTSVADTDIRKSNQHPDNRNCKIEDDVAKSSETIKTVLKRQDREGGCERKNNKKQPSQYSKHDSVKQVRDQHSKLDIDDNALTVGKVVSIEKIVKPKDQTIKLVGRNISSDKLDSDDSSTKNETCSYEPTVTGSTTEDSVKTLITELCDTKAVDVMNDSVRVAVSKSEKLSGDDNRLCKASKSEKLSGDDGRLCKASKSEKLSGDDGGLCKASKSEKLSGDDGGLCKASKSEKLSGDNGRLCKASKSEKLSGDDGLCKAEQLPDSFPNLRTSVTISNIMQGICDVKIEKLYKGSSTDINNESDSKPTPKTQCNTETAVNKLSVKELFRTSKDSPKGIMTPSTTAGDDDIHSAHSKHGVDSKHGSDISQQQPISNKAKKSFEWKQKDKRVSKERRERNSIEIKMCEQVKMHNSDKSDDVIKKQCNEDKGRTHDPLKRRQKMKIKHLDHDTNSDDLNSTESNETKLQMDDSLMKEEVRTVIKSKYITQTKEQLIPKSEYIDAKRDHQPNMNVNSARNTRQTSSDEEACMSKPPQTEVVLNTNTGTEKPPQYKHTSELDTSSNESKIRKNTSDAKRRLPKSAELNDNCPSIVGDELRNTTKKRDDILKQTNVENTKRKRETMTSENSVLTGSSKQKFKIPRLKSSEGTDELPETNEQKRNTLIECNICRQALYSNQADLDKHKIALHKDYNKPVFKCIICNLCSFSDKKCLLKHTIQCKKLKNIEEKSDIFSNELDSVAKESPAVVEASVVLSKENGAQMSKPDQDILMTPDKESKSDQPLLNSARKDVSNIEDKREFLTCEVCKRSDFKNIMELGEHKNLNHRPNRPMKKVHWCHTCSEAIFTDTIGINEHKQNCCKEQKAAPKNDMGCQKQGSDNAAAIDVGQNEVRADEHLGTPPDEKLETDKEISGPAKLPNVNSSAKVCTPSQPKPELVAKEQSRDPRGHEKDYSTPINQGNAFPFKCDICSACYKTNVLLSRHKDKNHTRISTEKSKCNVAVENKRMTDQLHENRISLKRLNDSKSHLLKCDMCEKDYFRSEEQLHNHKERVHKDGKTIRNVGTERNVSETLTSASLGTSSTVKAPTKGTQMDCQKEMHHIKCDYCNKTCFFSEQELRNHMNREHRNKCQDLDLSSKESNKNTILSSSPENPNKRLKESSPMQSKTLHGHPLVTKETNTVTEFQAKKKDGSPMLRCNICNKCYCKFESDMRKHNAQVHPNRGEDTSNFQPLVKCQQPQKTILSPTKDTSGLNIFKCDECNGAEFKSEQGLRHHNENKHKATQSLTADDTKQVAAKLEEGEYVLESDNKTDIDIASPVVIEVTLDAETPVENLREKKLESKTESKEKAVAIECVEREAKVLKRKVEPVADTSGKETETKRGTGYGRNNALKEFLSSAKNVEQLAKQIQDTKSRGNRRTMNKCRICRTKYFPSQYRLDLHMQHVHGSVNPSYSGEVDNTSTKRKNTEQDSIDANVKSPRCQMKTKDSALSIREAVCTGIEHLRIDSDNNQTTFENQPSKLKTRERFDKHKRSEDKSGENMDHQRSGIAARVLPTSTPKTKRSGRSSCEEKCVNIDKALSEENKKALRGQSNKPGEQGDRNMLNLNKVSTIPSENISMAQRSSPNDNTNQSEVDCASDMDLDSSVETETETHKPVNVLNINQVTSPGSIVVNERFKNDHLKTHGDRGSAKCNYCGWFFKYKSQLSSHIMTVHRANSPSPVKIKSPFRSKPEHRPHDGNVRSRFGKGFKCRKCFHSYSTKSALRQHIFIKGHKI